MLILSLFFFSCVTAPHQPQADDTEDSAVVSGSSEVEYSDNETAALENNPVTTASVLVEGDSVQEVSDALPPLSNTELFDEIYAMMPWNMTAVKDGSRPIVITHDLDKNGYEDALVIAVEGGDSEDDIEELSKSARLFQSGREYSNFLLLIFYQYSDEVILRYTVPVSKQLVFSGVEPVEIKQGSDFPYALLFSFRTRAGIEQELIILSGYGITRFSIKENLSEITLIEDIDEDGYEDIIVHEQGFEEGTGFETFLTWYKWNLRDYTEYRTTNIVRNLRQFYLICSEYLRAGETAAFLDYALDPEALSELKMQELSDLEILQMIFLPVDATAPAEGFFDGGGFNTVVFPEIMETPFSYANRMDFRQQVSVRMGRTGEQSRIYLAELNMKKNPFQNKQFCFSVEK